MNNRKIILYISPESWLYGAERSLYLLAKNITKANYEPIVMCPSEGPFPDLLRAEGIEVIIHKYTYLSKKNPLPFILGLCRLYKIVRKINPDIIHCNDRAVCQFSLPIARLSGIPIVTHVRNSTKQHYAVYEYLSIWVKNIIANSEYIRKDLHKYGYKANRIAVVYNPVEDYLFDIRGKKPDNICCIGFVGQVIKRKGLDILIKALSAVDNYKIQLSIFGEYQNDGYEEYIKELLTKLPENIVVKHNNYVSNQSVIYNSLDLVVMPSRNEPFGRVAAEAMAAGLPVIASRVGGLCEIVDDGKTGILFNVEDVQGLQKAIEYLAANPILCKNMGVEGRKKAYKLFSVNEHIKQLDAIYKGLLT